MGEAPLLNGNRLRFVRRTIIQWYEKSGRNYAWRVTTNPFQVLIAEMLLRRTTAAAVSRIYEEFIGRFNSLERLARARKATIERALSNVGLQKMRAHHMKQMARMLLAEHNGVVPNDLAALEALPGVGRYTAAAVMNFAFNVPEPMVDGNVVHLMNRLFSLRISGPTDNVIWEFMRTFGGTQDKRLYWGLIDLVSTTCLRRNPRCNICPLSCSCDFYTANPK
ncbi:MAG: hypothetical protein ACW96N_02985 [Candidatus Thorarchaeota archaeon]|jgi:A/G-specific adenine glycosylase